MEVDHADGDARPEILVETDASGEKAIAAMKLDGSVLWEAMLDKDQIGPTCTGSWRWSFVGFSDIDPTPGMETVFAWYDPSGSDCGVTVTGTAAHEAPPQGGEGDAIAWLSFHPDPVRRGATLRFRLARPGRVSLAITDVRGRLVRSLGSGRLAEGWQELPWDGLDDEGRPIASGM